MPERMRRDVLPPAGLFDILVHDATHTAVVWTLHYTRGLDPEWYFGPLERYAVRLAAGYLIDNLATP